jgi:hypothetical protein
VSFEIVRTGQAIFIDWDKEMVHTIKTEDHKGNMKTIQYGAKCRNSNLNEELGQVFRYIVSTNDDLI